MNLTSFLSGLAMGGVITMLATIAIVPGGGGNADPTALTPVFGGAVPGGAQPIDGEADDASSATVPNGSAESGPSGSGGEDTVAGGAGVSLGGGGGGGTGLEGGGGGGGSCRGGATGEPGVGDKDIKLGATVVRDGIAEDFLGETLEAMQAVVKRVNREGGVCGRQINLIHKDDGWDPRRGRDAIENLIRQDKVFALAVSPSSEGLNTASDAGLFRDHKVPVIGSDGLNNTQFRDPWIWPVAAATTTTVHAIMQDAWDRCEKHPSCDSLEPAIVFGNTYRFGLEGAYAFNAAYCRVSGGQMDEKSGKCSGGKTIPGYEPGGTQCAQGSRFCGISADDHQYGTQVLRLKDACQKGPQCNFMLLLLEPQTAQQWMGTPNVLQPKDLGSGSCCGMAGAQPLFTAGFAKNCGDRCHQMQVWTGYNPPIEQYAPERYEPTRTYVSDLHGEKGRADEFNQFTLGAYVGMLLVVDVLERAGSQPTRAGVAQILNSMPPFKTGLTNPEGLVWRADQRYANHSAQAFMIPASGGWTGTWKPVRGYLKDPWLGKDNCVPGDQKC